MKYLLLFYSLLLSSFALAQEQGSSRSIKAIFLVDEREKLLETDKQIQIRGIEILGVDLPGKILPFKKRLSKFLEQPFQETTLKQIRGVIYQHYRTHNRPLVRVTIPKQTAKMGILQVLVEESKLGEIKVVGNKWSPSKRYEDYFTIAPGAPISQSAVNRSMDFINRSPFRSVNMSYSPGTRPNTTDLTLEVTDRRPYIFYAGCDNTGVPSTGRQRIFAGFGWDQIGGIDQSFFYQYTTNYNTNRFHSNTFQYTVLCPWKAIFNLYGGFSKVHASLHPAPIHNHGTNIQASIRYITPFRATPAFSQEIIGGFDVKNTNNTMEFTDTTPIFGQTVNITQWVIGYKCRYTEKKLVVEGDVEGVFSPFQWVPGQTSADYESLRPGADNRWFYLLGSCHIHYLLPYSCAMHVRVNGELSFQTLLPSEQLGIGGHASVRGYDERQYNGDSGLVAGWEFHSPNFTLLRGANVPINRAYFLYFFDAGFGVDNTKVPEVPRANFLAGTGIGLRYYLAEYLKARIDYGIKLHHQKDFTGGASEVYFNVTGSF